MKLKSMSKSTVHVQSKVHAIHDTRSLKTNPKPLNNWITSLEELNEQKNVDLLRFIDLELQNYIKMGKYFVEHSHNLYTDYPKSRLI